MKKMVSLMLALALVFTSVSCFAAEPEAKVHEVQNNVFIEGKVDNYIAGEILRLTLEDAKGEPVYIAEYDDVVDINGKYAIKFKYQGDMNKLKLNLAYGDELVTDSEVTATVTSQIMEADVFVTDANDKSYEYNIDQTIPSMKFNEWSITDKDGNTHTFKAKEYESIHSIDARTGLKAVVNIKNKYAYEEEVSIMVAAYDKNNKLLDCKIEKLTTEYAADGKIQSGETVAISVPDGTVKAKAFCWSSTSNLIPFGEQADGELPKVDVFLIGDSYGDIYGIDYYPESGWGMHLGNYFNSKYVTIHNYCKSGAWVQSVMSNKKDSKYLDDMSSSGMPGWGKWGEMLNDANLSEGDYIIVSLGINDASKSGVDENGNKISSVDWYGLGLEDMVKSAKEHGLNIILCTPMPTPGTGVNKSDNEKDFSARTEEVAKKYGVPYLDMVTNIKDFYKENLGYSEDMTDAEKDKINENVYRKFYLVRDTLMEKPNTGDGFGFGLTEDDIKYHAQAASFNDPNENYRNFHPNVRGADTMAYYIAKLLKDTDTDSDLRFYVR